VKGELYPSVFLSGNVNSNYSSGASRDIFLNSVETATNDYVMVGGTKSPVITTINKYNSEKIGYTTQLKNNIFTNIGVGIRIPVFNGMQTRNRIKLAEIELKAQDITVDETKRQLRQEVEQAFVNMNNAYTRYRMSLEQVTAYAESFRAAEVRYNAGVGTSVDYLIAKNNLDRANLNLIMAKYDYLLRKKVVEFYGVR
jgi:outer membrane protein